MVTTDELDAFTVNTAEGGGDSLGVIVGVSFLGIIIVVASLIILGIIIYFCYAQYKFKDSLKVRDGKV